MAKQLVFKRTLGWGGKRKGSGRPNLSGTVGHIKREVIKSQYPLHITLRIREKIPTLRRKVLLTEFKKSIANAKVHGINVIHFSLQSNHIHLFAESSSNKFLALGMRSLAGRFAKIIKKNAAISKHVSGSGKSTAGSTLARSLFAGSVFKGRYHLHILKTPQEVRNALEYVLLNISKHQRLIEYIDPYSSAQTFTHWRKLLGKRYNSLIKFHSNSFQGDSIDNDSFRRDSCDRDSFKSDPFVRVSDDRSSPDERIIPNDLSDVLSSPRSWLGKVGWMKACT
ncbi:MAG: transposase [Oligoflexia bacterium]|nr:transposase [Oligoflexia bacterium]